MEGKAVYIFPAVVTAIIVFVVSAVLTVLHVGLGPAFLLTWATSFILGWPVAAVTAYFAIPVARRLTGRIVARLEGRA